MRYSSYKDDPGYTNWMGNTSIVVLLDGVEQRHCTVADEEQGLVVRCALDSDGNPQVDPEHPDEVLMETVHGVVRVVP
jgi:hypothetical protein